jgi:hypothetical protein
MRSSTDGSCLSLIVIDSGSKATYMAIKLQQFGATQYDRLARVAVTVAVNTTPSKEAALHLFR